MGSKKGNGLEFLQHLEAQAQRKHVRDMQPSLDTRDNLFYTKMRDTLEAQQARFAKVKNREIEAQNEKMFGRLIKILNTESSNVGKTRNGLGP